MIHLFKLRIPLFIERSFWRSSIHAESSHLSIFLFLSSCIPDFISATPNPLTRARPTDEQISHKCKIDNISSVALLVKMIS